jgi:putative transposase
MIEFGHDGVSVFRQCELLGLARSTLYYQPRGVSEKDLELMRGIDEQFTSTPFYGSRRIREWLRSVGYEVSRKKVIRLMLMMGLQAIYPKPKLSRPGKNHRIYPYLLKEVQVHSPNQVWSADITYIRLRKGFIYLVAILDWYSRYVLAWEISITLDAQFCVSALQRALMIGKPEIFNTDQGAQFTSEQFLEVLERNDIQISMDGRGRALDNVFVERLWRTVKYEEVYLKEYETVIEAVEGIRGYFEFYNKRRFHQSLGYKTPAEVYLDVVARDRAYSLVSAVGE